MKGVTSSIRTLRKFSSCLTCGKRWDGPNALAVAARHSPAFRHDCIGEATTSHSYAPDIKRTT